MDTLSFQKTIWEFYKKHGRDLPWRYEKDPYKVLVSEVMLQQTQVSRVLYKYKEWLEKFPTVESLANASLRDVLIVWQGLGYNRRGKYLKEAAEKIVSDFKGRVPDRVEELVTLPGIGHATAAAVVAYAFNKPVIFIETNIRAVYLYFYFKKDIHVSDKQITDLIEKTLDSANSRDWYYALTDYGNMLKNKAKFKNTQSKHYTKQSKFIGSKRQVRGFVLQLLTKHPNMPEKELFFELQQFTHDSDEILADLMNEGIVVKKGTLYSIGE